MSCVCLAIVMWSIMEGLQIALGTVGQVSQRRGNMEEHGRVSQR